VHDAAEHALIAHAHALRVDGATLRAIQAVLEAQHRSRLSLDALHHVPAEQQPRVGVLALAPFCGSNSMVGAGHPRFGALGRLRRYGWTAGLPSHWWEADRSEPALQAPPPASDAEFLDIRIKVGSLM
jgi:hypothetical protein